MFALQVTQCCRWPLTIDFDEFGWEWVLFPKTFEAGFCSGDCSLGQLKLIISRGKLIRNYLTQVYPRIQTTQPWPNMPNSTPSAEASGPAAPARRCRTSTCSTWTRRGMSSSANFQTWRWNVVAVPESSGGVVLVLELIYQGRFQSDFWRKKIDLTELSESAWKSFIYQITGGVYQCCK